ncbi:bacteriocin [Scytonema sp. PCC 10023]|uniref:bacteriocin n=1 Tax=Scytonema sp. PCC 10023 TaxID=1680591 RepID=UPI0039C7270D
MRLKVVQNFRFRNKKDNKLSSTAVLGGTATSDLLDNELQELSDNELQSVVGGQAQISVDITLPAIPAVPADPGEPGGGAVPMLPAIPGI